MKTPSAFHRGQRQLEIAMTPMIDVVFLLLVFFVWTASFQIVERLLPSKIEEVGGTAMAEVTPPELMDLERVVVRIEVAGGQTRWSINKQPVTSLDAVRNRLGAVASIRTDLPVTIDPDPEVTVGETIDVYDVARSLGFSKIQFTAPEN